MPAGYCAAISMGGRTAHKGQQPRIRGVRAIAHPPEASVVAAVIVSVVKMKAPAEAGAGESNSATSDLHHGFLEVLRGPEGNLLAGLDLDGLARRRVATHACCALPDLQDAEA